MDFGINDIVEGEIIDFTHEGDGVLKVDNLAIFVPKGIIGDKVKVKIIEKKKNYAIGSIVNLIEPSLDRVKDSIEESHGGLPLIDYKYEKQLKWKENKVKIDVEKITGLTNIIVNKTLGMNEPYRYRNHVQIPIGNKDGKTILGFFEKDSKKIVDMKGSILQPEEGDKILEIIRSWIDKYHIEPNSKESSKDIIKHIGLRFNYKNQIMVIIVTSSDNLINKRELVEALTTKANGVVSIYHNINKGRNSATYGQKYIKIYGEDYIEDYIGNYKFKISPNSFFQVNRIQAEILYNKTIDYLELKKEDIVFDLYCGIGTISLYIADKAKRVYGVETVKEAINDAKKNAVLNNISNAEFIVGKAEDIFPKLLKKGVKGNKVVVDPPRKGCEKEVLEAIANLSPERVVYVSCNPSTMARDIKYLIENGYGVKEIQPIDMFPHTAHVESIVKLENYRT